MGTVERPKHVLLVAIHRKYMYRYVGHVSAIEKTDLDEVLSP